MTDFTDEVFDDDGYPTEAFLDHIKSWDWKRGHEALLDFAMSGHIYPTYWEKASKDGETVWDISTGGWSGNESIIGALMENPMFWALCWQQSRRGGHYIFRTKASE